MRKKPRIRTRTIILMGLLAIVGTIIWQRLPEPTPPYREIITSEPGNPHVVWRPMRLRWSFEPKVKDFQSSISDLIDGGDRLFFSCSSEVGCVSKRDGKPIWRTRMMTDREIGNASGSGQAPSWRITADSDSVIAVESRDDAGPGNPPKTSRVRRLDKATGKLIWEKSFTSAQFYTPCLHGETVVLSSTDGHLHTLSLHNGKTIWSLKAGHSAEPGGPSPSSYDTPWMKVRMGQGLVIVATGSRIGCFRLSDGKRLWADPTGGKAAKEAETEDSMPFALSDGVVYCIRDRGRVRAINAETGKQIWGRNANSFYPVMKEVVTDKNRMFSVINQNIVCVRKSDGATVWHLPAAEGWGGYYEEMLMSIDGSLRLEKVFDPETLVLIGNDHPLINGSLRSPSGMQGVSTISVYDAATGHERWRWQPLDGATIENPILNGDRLYAIADLKLVAYERGMPPPLPSRKGDRQHLAQRMFKAISAWPKDEDSLQNKLRNLLPASIRSLLSGGDQTSKPSESEARLTLLRLGKDSIEPIVAYLRARVRTGKTIAGSQVWGTLIQPNQGVPSDVANPLAILNDLDAFEAVPELTRLLGQSKEPKVRRAIAEALMQLADARAIPALWKLAQSATEDDNVREDALHFICRAADVAPQSATNLLPPRDEVTQFLQSILEDPKSAPWLRTFAKFELLNDRGESARLLALSSFRSVKSVSVLPPRATMKRVPNDIYPDPSVPGFHTEFHGVTATDTRGIRWAAFHSNYLGGSNQIWFVQSVDGKKWTRPVFAADLNKYLKTKGGPDSFSLHCQGTTLILDWKESEYDNRKEKTWTVKHRNEFRIDDLYRDTDGDGIPDLMETQFGLNPRVADSNGNGIPDYRDPNPVYKPHPRSESEEIYETVLEALCQIEQPVTTGTPPKRWQGGTLFGKTFRPAVLPLPPGSTGISLSGCDSPLFYFPTNEPRAGKLEMSTVNLAATVEFSRPTLGLDGVARLTEVGPKPRHGDPFTLPPQDWDESYTFERFFPIEKSKDGTRMRIGSGIAWSGTPNIDVMIRRIDGHWYPVECRLVRSFRPYGSAAALPFRPIRWPKAK